jgi:hypothetical protein
MDEESRCLQHYLLFLIYDFGDILSHPQCKKIQSISYESEENIKPVYLLTATLKKYLLKQQLQYHAS